MKNNCFSKLLIILLSVISFQAAAVEKSRYIVLTDISNEPDDEESLVRYLVYANEFDTEGLIATTSTHLRETTREDLIRRQLAAYAMVKPNLDIHSGGFPDVDSLRSVTCTGQTGYGMEFVGKGKGSPGSRRIVEAVDRNDVRPLWIGIWGGANTLAQALYDVRESRTTEEVQEFVSKIKVYSISDQDDAGPWIRREFPGLFYIVSPSAPHWLEYYKATWIGISGERNGVGVYHKFDMVDNPWLEQHVMKNHGPLGELYPPLKYIMEGDTPSYLGLINRGLGWEQSPANGGWGGRYTYFQVAGESHPIWTETTFSRDSVTSDNGRSETSSHATIWRWREHFQNDFAARMDWCVADSFEAANHNPIAVLNGDTTKNVLTVSAKSGSTAILSADGSGPGDDNQTISYNWWIYDEAGNTRGAQLLETKGSRTTVYIPEHLEPINPYTPANEVHVILEVKDDGIPNLVSYRRVILKVN